MIIGVHGEYASVPWVKVYAVPESVSLLTAAAALLQGTALPTLQLTMLMHDLGLTAITFITESYNVKKGDYVFVHTIAGGLGLLFSQMAKDRGAIVIGTTSTQEKADLAKKHGADHVILYPTENTVERVLEITNGEGVHVIYDGVGKDTCVSLPYFTACMRCKNSQNIVADSKTTSSSSDAKALSCASETRPVLHQPSRHLNSWRRT